MAYQQEIAHVTLGILGNIASCAFFLSSLPTVLKIIKQKSLGGLSGDLYAFKLFNCLLWTLYGLPMVHPHNFWVLLTNSIGCFLSLIYISSYIYAGSRRERWSIIWKLVVISSVFIIVVVVLLLVEDTKHVRLLVIGMLCVIVSSGMHLTLLSQLRMTLRTKDSRYMQPKASVAAFMKGAIWTAYGVVNFDVYIVIPNGVGIVTGFVQLVVAAYLILETEKKKPKHDQIIPTFVISNQTAVVVEQAMPMQKSGVTVEDIVELTTTTTTTTTTNKEEHELQQQQQQQQPQQQNVGRVLSNLQIRGVVVPIDGLDGY